MYGGVGNKFRLWWHCLIYGHEPKYHISAIDGVCYYVHCKNCYYGRSKY
uniref:Uncharacterized protein n=1 Tax=viral metagenome TaxID=1070528 RepID=A0A6M3JJR6_9ZZZZ